MKERPLLEEKLKTQKKLDELANHDLKQYFKNSHENVLELSKKYGFNLNYGQIEGGLLLSDKDKPATIVK